jgi:hypothetical protein
MAHFIADMLMFPPLFVIYRHIYCVVFGFNSYSLFSYLCCFQNIDRFTNLIRKMSHDYYVPEYAPVMEGFSVVACRHCGMFQPRAPVVCPNAPQQLGVHPRERDLNPPAVLVPPAGKG